MALAYDFVSTIAYIKDNEAALKFSRTKRFDRYSEDELAHLAAKALLPERLVLDTARETVALFHQCWHAEKANLPETDRECFGKPLRLFRYLDFSVKEILTFLPLYFIVKGVLRKRAVFR